MSIADIDLKNWTNFESPKSGLARILLICGLLALPFQVVQISIAQPAHLWMLLAILYIIAGRHVEFTIVELSAFLIFLWFALVTTFLQDYPRVKVLEQIMKFSFFYPGFFLVGRFFGKSLRFNAMPLGYAFLFLSLGAQYIVQAAAIPIVYQAIDFGQNALHGTFRERNWLAMYYFMFSYVLLILDRSPRKFVPFLALNLATTILCGSKTVIVACALVYFIRSQLTLSIKLIPILAGITLYAIVFSSEFSQEKLDVKLQEERGLALQVSSELIEENPLGYGFGFVEGYFSRASIVPKGLGEGTNSVFSVPIDLWLIAGVAGLFFWLVIFVGVGNGGFVVMLPIAALSLLNPLHQSEIVYFFSGMLVSISRWSSNRSTAAYTNRQLSRPPGPISQSD